MNELETLISKLPGKSSDCHMYFLDLLGDDLSDSTQSRLDGLELWQHLTSQNPPALLAYLVSVSEKDLPDYLESLWEQANQALEEIKDAVEDSINEELLLRLERLNEEDLESTFGDI